MAKWIIEPTSEKLQHTLENIYMIARLQRAITHSYLPDGSCEQIGPKSTDEVWDHIIGYCEEAGLRPTMLRAMEGVKSADPRKANARPGRGR